jgi:hypothetical protein
MSGQNREAAYLVRVKVVYEYRIAIPATSVEQALERVNGLNSDEIEECGVLDSINVSSVQVIAHLPLK